MFITLEGIEGAGKTSLVPHMERFLRRRGHHCVTTREPGGTVIGGRLRAILLDPQNADMEPGTELLLYTADRLQHVRTLIAPALAAGHTVLCDRYVDATVVYQGVARGIQPQRVLELHRLMLDGLMPDLTLLLDLSPREGLRRAWDEVKAGGRTADETRFEKEALDFHERVRSGYLDRAAGEPDRFRVIDAGRSLERVRDDILTVLAQAL